MYKNIIILREPKHKYNEIVSIKNLSLYCVGFMLNSVLKLTREETSSFLIEK